MQHSRLLASVVTVLILFLSAAQAAIVCGQRAERRVATGSLPPPKFADADRARKLAAAFPEIEKIFSNWFAARHAPGAVFGIIIDGELVWVKDQRRARNKGSRSGYSGHSVSHRVDDQELYRAFDPQTARRRKTITRRSSGSLCPGFGRTALSDK